MSFYKFKAVLLGDAGVGKTSLINSVITSSFNSAEKATLSASYQTYKQVSEDTTYDIQFWDTAGQERFQSLAVMYYRDAPVILITFALNARDSFEKLPQWVNQVKENTTIDPIIIFVGNKVDLVDERCISMSEIATFAQEKNAAYVEISAKTRIGIDDLVKLIINLYGEKKKAVVPTDTVIIKATDTQATKPDDKKCC